MFSRYISFASLTALTLLIIPTAKAQGVATYGFAKVAESGQETYSSLTNGTASINNSGVVAFQAYLTNGQAAVFKRTGATGNATMIATTLGAPYGPLFFGTAIDDTGSVAFHDQLDAGGEGIFRGNGTTTTTIATTQTSGNSNYSDFSMNSAGTVAYQGTISSGANYGVYTSDGSSARTTVATSADIYVTHAPAINSAGTVAFLQSNRSDAGIYARAGGSGSIISVATLSGNRLISFGADLSLNSAGTIAFTATPADLGTLNYGIYTRTGVGVPGAPLGTLTNLIDSTGIFQSFQTPTLNSNGDIVFNASLDAGGSGIYFMQAGVGSIGGGAPTGLVRVIGTGDALFGSTVYSASVFRQGMNDSDQIAFSYTLNDGRTGVAIAGRTDITVPGAAAPEPGSLLLVGSACIPLIGLLGVRRRTKKSIAKNTQ